MPTTNPADSLPHWPASVLAAVLVGLFVIVGVWDITCLYYGRRDCTVSSVIGGWAETYPILPFVLGILAGHVLWPRG